MAYPPAWTTTFRSGGAKHPALLDELGNLEKCRIDATYLVGAVAGSGVNDVALEGNTTQTATASGTLGIAIGRNASASAANAIAVGGHSATGAAASAASAIAVGQQAASSKADAIAIGRASTAGGGVGDTGAVCVGAGATATGDGSLALGKGTQALVDGAVSIGPGVTSSVVNGVSLGANATTYLHIPPPPFATVKQATNNTTAVTINAVVGQIEMNTTTVGNTTYTFTVNNSFVAATSLVFITNGDLGSGTRSYGMVGASGVTAGSFTLALRNIVAGDPPKFNFIVLYPTGV